MEYSMIVDKQRGIHACSLLTRELASELNDEQFARFADAFTYAPLDMRTQYERSRDEIAQFGEHAGVRTHTDGLTVEINISLLRAQLGISSTCTDDDTWILLPMRDVAIMHATYMTRMYRLARDAFLSSKTL